MSDQPTRAAFIGVGVVSVCGLVVSGYLAWLSFSAGGQGFGCGGWEGVDCEAVLASRWSSWLGVPVSVLAVMVYATVLMTMQPAARSGSLRGRAIAWRVIVGLAAATAGAGVWFIGLQALVLEKVCPYCIAAHLCGLGLAGVAVIFGPTRGRAITKPVVAGLTGVVALIAGQLLVQPASYSVERVLVAKETAPATLSTIAQPADLEGDAPPTETLATPVSTKTLTVLGVEIDPAQWPRIGRVDAPHLAVKLFDYTCPKCRELNSLLHEAAERYPVAFLLAPMPLDKNCNPYINKVYWRHANACKYAKYAMAVWSCDSEKYAEFEEYLFKHESPPSVREARAFAKKLVGEEKLRLTLAEPWLNQRIQTAIKIYRSTKRKGVPTLVIKDHTIVGVPDQVELLYKELEVRLGIKPLSVGDTP